MARVMAKSKNNITIINIEDIENEALLASTKNRQPQTLTLNSPLSIRA